MRMRWLTIAAALICIAGFTSVLSSAIWAQQTLPSTGDPNRLEQRFTPRPEPRATDKPLIPDVDEPLPPEEAEKVKFFLRDITFEGVTVYDETALRPYFEAHVGQQTSLAVVYEVAEAIANRYRNDGYILVQVFPPAQTVDGGTVTLRVMEGFIHTLEVEGDVEGHKSLISTYAENIIASRPLNNKVLERYLLLINDLPGVTARAILLPSFEQPGAFDLILQVKRRSLEGYASIDNRGTRFIGPYQLQGSISANTLLGRSDRTELRYIQTSQPEELRYAQLDHSEPIGAEGTVVRLSATASDANPGFTLEPLDVDSFTETYQLAVMHPIIRSRRRNLSAQLSVRYRNSLTDLQAQRLSEDRLRILAVGATADLADQWGGVNLLDAELSQGLDILGARGSEKAHPTRPFGRTDFTKVKATATRLQRITDAWRVLLSADAQYAFSQLLASEEFGFGGGNIGRAFDPSEFSGDHGAVGKLELQYLWQPEVTYVKALQIYGYYDYGTVWRRHSVAVDGRDTASAVGAGVRFGLVRNIAGSFELAKPLIGRVAARGQDGSETRAFFSLSARF